MRRERIALAAAAWAAAAWATAAVATPAAAAPVFAAAAPAAAAGPPKEEAVEDTVGRPEEGEEVKQRLASAVAGPWAPLAPRYDWPPFTNWDCTDVRGVLDWDRLYEKVSSALRGEAPNEGGEATDDSRLFFVPGEASAALLAQADAALEECPLGTLYLLVIYTYELITEGTKDRAAAARQADIMSEHLRAYPFFVIAAARWPTFAALHHFGPLHKPQTSEAKATRCVGVRGASGIDWDTLLTAALRWGEDQMAGHEPGQGKAALHGRVIKAASDVVYKDPQGAGDAAQAECPYGFLFLCVAQALASSMHLTGMFEAWARAVDRMLAELPFYSISGSGWPTYQMLAFFSTISMGIGAGVTLGSFQADVQRWGNKHPVVKRFREYGDLRLTHSELAPLGPGRQGWDAVDNLIAMRAEAWYATLVGSQVVRGARPVVARALEAVMATLRAATYPFRRECGGSGLTPEACKARGCEWRDEPPSAPAWSPMCQRLAPRRKVVAVTFVWGEKWAALVPGFAAWVTRLGIATIIVAMGEACQRACEAAAGALGGAGSGGVACWDPLATDGGAAAGKQERGSILQRHVMVHLLLHMGVDALAFDFDTFLFSDPRPRLEALAAAGGADVLMTRHLDADCLNMGLMYVQASSRTAEWYSRYLAWLHQHPFEREQRGANALSGFTGQGVSFPPKGLPRIRVVALDDQNEFASSRGGWLGDFSQLRFFHWVNPSETQVHWAALKVADLTALYKGALHYSVQQELLAWGSSLSTLLAAAKPGEFLHVLRQLMESFRAKEVPERQVCW